MATIETFNNKTTNDNPPLENLNENYLKIKKGIKIVLKKNKFFYLN